ncbi:hypothetical protein NMK71_06435 [Weeksellaceae bacterium KMM 9713]|uniref:Membrane protein DedA, SNARE-associated domain n=1 Tax=Profundicola chukchiensis TaxID=2961959 RepID=A0A9X4MYQ5_9FLAO|nr:hypothetical protein [Profundicola chukchiensis]MDG4946045.1 hypothetical protein [Profundicola chukchiensis]
MWWQYILVFLGAFLFDVVPFPFPPAYTIMTLLQIIFDLNIWLVVIIGVLGSVGGRYTLMLLSSRLASKYLDPKKSEDFQLLGAKMKESKWKGQLMVLTYSLLPLPTTPLFLGAGASKLNPIYILPAFFIGRLVTNALAVHMGSFAEESIQTIIRDSFSLKSLMSIVISILFFLAMFAIDWKALVMDKKLVFNLGIKRKTTQEG